MSPRPWRRCLLAVALALALSPLAREGKAGDSPAGWSNLRRVISEVRFGPMWNDVRITEGKKEDGLSLNGEVLFNSPEFLAIIFSPRPHAGFTLNTEGNTSLLYAGLTWQWAFWPPFFAEVTFGGALHDGELHTRDEARRELGCRALFRESLAIGVTFRERHTVSLTVEHNSNASLCSKNDGLNIAGLRYGYRF